MKVFGTPFKGDPLFYYAASVIYVICTAGAGLLVSLLVRTQVAAVMLTLVISFVPAMLYSGLAGADRIHGNGNQNRVAPVSGALLFADFLGQFSQRPGLGRALV